MSKLRNCTFFLNKCSFIFNCSNISKRLGQMDVSHREASPCFNMTLETMENCRDQVLEGNLVPFLSDGGFYLFNSAFCFRMLQMFSIDREVWRQVSLAHWLLYNFVRHGSFVVLMYKLFCTDGAFPHVSAVHARGSNTHPSLQRGRLLTCVLITGQMVLLHLSAKDLGFVVSQKEVLILICLITESFSIHLIVNVIFSALVHLLLVYSPGLVSVWCSAEYLSKLLSSRIDTSHPVTHRCSCHGAPCMVRSAVMVISLIVKHFLSPVLIQLVSCSFSHSLPLSPVQVSPNLVVSF